MIHFSVRLGAVVACLSLLLYASSAGAENDATSEKSAILRQLQEMRQEIRSLKEEIGELRKDIAVRKRAAALRSAAPTVSHVSLKQDSPVLGDSHAKVAIVEFSDYQCPYCARFHAQAFPKLVTEYIDTGKIKFISRDYPLGFHTHAKQAAIAASCAADQGAFDKMSEGLYTHQSQLGPALYEELAGKLKLDVNLFETCLKHPEKAKEVDDDLAYGKQIGVSGTPSFFIGKIEGNHLVDARSLEGAQPFQVFSQIIDSMLK